MKKLQPERSCRLDRDPDVYNHKRLHSLNGGLYWCQDHIVEIVLVNGTDKLEQSLHEVLEGSAGQKAAQYADILLAEFIRHSVLDGFREVEAPMRAAYEPFAEAHQKQEEARLATEQATCIWEAQAEDFRPKLKVLGKWAESAALARHRRLRRREPNPFAYMTVVGTSNWLKTPGDFVKNHDSCFREINFIRETSEVEVIEGRLERPVGMSDFESSLKAFEAAQASVEERQNEEVNAKAARESARLKFNEEQKKAIRVLQPLSDAGRWALFRLFSPNTPEAG